jgi:16S rRNA (guanine527-N7)-methyltransferase
MGSAARFHLRGLNAVVSAGEYLNADAIAELLQPYIAGAAAAGEQQPDWPHICAQLSIYLRLILKWNARINLTAIRTPEEIVRRHFGESLFVGLRLGECPTLLDFGSGAGFPGVPIQLLRPDVAVTLAESQSKKAAFLHEVARSLGLSAEIWAGRVEAMPADRRFDTVALRAVDRMETALAEAARRASRRILILGTKSAQYSELAEQFPVTKQTAMPETSEGAVWELRRLVAG